MTARWRTIRGSFFGAWRILRMAGAAMPCATIAFASLNIATGLLPLGMAYVGKRIVNAIVANDPTRALRAVLTEFLLVVALAGSQRCLAAIRQFVGGELCALASLETLRKAVTLSYQQFEDPDLYDKLARARREIVSRPLSVMTHTFNLAQCIAALIGYSVFLVRFSAWTLPAILATTIPAAIAEARFSGHTFRVLSYRSQDSRRLRYIEDLLSTDEYAKEVRMLGLAQPFLERYRSLTRRFNLEDMGFARSHATWGFLLSLLASVAFYVCYGAMILRTAAGGISFGDLMLYMLSFRQGQQAFQMMLSELGGIFEDGLYVGHMFAVLDLTALPSFGTATLPTHSPTSTASVATERGLRLENVGFMYSGHREWALRNVTVTIPDSSTVGIVGPNGAGKTTLIKLLTRLYTPTEGRILLDGRDLQEWPEDALRRRFAVLWQDFARYKLTAGENIGVGCALEMHNAAQIWRAAELGGAGAVLRSLPRTLETQLGRWFDGGVELSGGQWQRIALARALMNAQADIIILDEPSAALDADGELALVGLLPKVASGKTTIVASHRPALLKPADLVLVLENATLIESGNHSDLLRRCDRYARWVAPQEGSGSLHIA